MSACPHGWIATGALVLLTARVALSAVQVEANTRCLDKAGLTSRLQDALLDHAESRPVDLLVLVHDRETSDSTEITLKGVTGDGDLVLDRQFALSVADCESSTDLLATVLSRFVQELPLERWTLGPAIVGRLPPRPPPPPEGLSLSVSGRVTANMALVPTGGALEGTVTTDIGKTRHALALEISTIASYPSNLGQGRCYTVLLQGGAGWRYAPEPWLMRIGVRAGALMAAGRGFATNDKQWLPWTEAACAAGRSLGPVVLLASVAVSPYRHTAVTADKQLSKDISNLRIGVALEMPIWGTEF